MYHNVWLYFEPYCNRSEKINTCSPHVCPRILHTNFIHTTNTQWNNNEIKYKTRLQLHTRQMHGATHMNLPWWESSIYTQFGIILVGFIACEHRLRDVISEVRCDFLTLWRNVIKNDIVYDHYATFWIWRWLLTFIFNQNRSSIRWIRVSQYCLREPKLFLA